jgi:hypothetical protein
LPNQIKPVLESMQASVPAQFQSQWQALVGGLSGGSSSLDLNEFTGVGQSFGTAVSTAASKAAEAQFPGAGTAVSQLFAPYIGRLDHAFFEAFSQAIGDVFLFGVVTTVIAGIIALGLREIPLRTTAGHAAAKEAKPAEGRRVPALD